MEKVGGGRLEDRNPVNEAVRLTSVDQSWVTENTWTQNLSFRGARVATERVWQPGSHLLLKSLQGDFTARARVVYWRSFSSSRFAIGLEFLTRAGDWPANDSGTPFPAQPGPDPSSE